MREFNISCDSCNIRATVKEGAVPRTAPSRLIYYCSQCKKILNWYECKCGTMGRRLKSPELPYKTLKHLGGEFAIFEPGATAITDCPSCNKKTLKWVLVEEYEI